MCECGGATFFRNPAPSNEPVKLLPAPCRPPAWTHTPSRGQRAFIHAMLKQGGGEGARKGREGVRSEAGLHWISGDAHGSAAAKKERGGMHPPSEALAGRRFPPAMPAMSFQGDGQVLA